MRGAATRGAAECLTQPYEAGSAPCRKAGKGTEGEEKATGPVHGAPGLSCVVAPVPPRAEPGTGGRAPPPQSDPGLPTCRTARGADSPCGGKAIGKVRVGCAGRAGKATGRRGGARGVGALAPQGKRENRTGMIGGAGSTGPVVLVSQKRPGQGGGPLFGAWALSSPRRRAIRAGPGPAAAVAAACVRQLYKLFNQPDTIPD